jgi:heat shock protein HtpX
MLMNRLDILVILSTLFVFLLLAIIFSILLYLVGGSLIFAIAFSFLMIAIQWYVGPWIVKLSTGAREVSEEEAPELHKIVEEIATKSGVKKPKVCIVDSKVPNAFAFGRTQSDSYIAVHTGLLKILNRDELKSVIAHEIGHIKHRDVFVITMASVLPVILYWAAIILLSGRDRDGRNWLAVWVGGILAQLIGQLAVLWLSRQREYFADAHSKEIMGDPVPLARSLVKITANIDETNPTMKAFYIGEKEEIPESIVRAISGGRKDIEDAIKGQRETFDLFSTHPSVLKRIKALFA